jgi:hypothetical protein
MSLRLVVEVSVGSNGFRSCNHTVPLALVLQGRLMIDSTGSRTGGNENAASIIQCVGVEADMPD